MPRRIVSCRSLLILVLCLSTPVTPFSIYNAARELRNSLLGSPPPWSIDTTTESLCRDTGYPIETHLVHTQDGYILEMHRIPTGKNFSSKRDESKYPVIIQHGNFQSSADWLLNTPDTESLGFFLAEKGYDVWLGNQRGNEYSRRHSNPDLSRSSYWNYSFHEMGMYDLPAMLDYVTGTSGRPKTHFIGFSMGTTLFFAGLSKRPEYSDKIGVGIAMGPSTFQDHFFLGWVKLFAPFSWFLQQFTNVVGEMPVLPHFLAKLLHKILPIICHPKVDVFGICISVVQVGFGHDQGIITKERLHVVTKVSPSPSPMKAFIHELQLMGTGRFCEFDYGRAKNLMTYGREKPPDYNLTNVRAPIALIVGPNDFLAHKEDAKTLAKRLPNLVDFHYVPYEHFTHLDFCYASDVSALVYEKIETLLRQFDGT